VPTLSSLFPETRRVSLAAVPRSLASPGSSSQELGLSFRVLPDCHLPATAVPGIFLGVCLPFATSVRRVHFSPGVPRPTMFRPQRFSRSRRFTPPHTLWAYFIPLPRPGFTLQGLSPLPSRLASSTSRTLLSFDQILLPASRLPGARSSCRAFRALIRAAIRCSRQTV